MKTLPRNRFSEETRFRYKIVFGYPGRKFLLSDNITARFRNKPVSLAFISGGEIRSRFRRKASPTILDIAIITVLIKFTNSRRIGI